SPACGGGVGRGQARTSLRVCPLPVPPPQAGEGTLLHRPSPLRLSVVLALALALAAAPAAALDQVKFGTTWLGEAEHGGFYQALADGTYRKYGLDVAIVPGGPNVNNRILLPVGKLDFFMSANTMQGFDAVAQNIPTLAVAAMFQKDPQVL